MKQFVRNWSEGKSTLKKKHLGYETISRIQCSQIQGYEYKHILYWPSLQRQDHCGGFARGRDSQTLQETTSP